LQSFDTPSTESTESSQAYLGTYNK
jgi:hypothetical protein